MGSHKKGGYNFKKTQWIVHWCFLIFCLSAGLMNVRELAISCQALCSNYPVCRGHLTGIRQLWHLIHFVLTLYTLLINNCPLATPSRCLKSGSVHLFVCPSFLAYSEKVWLWQVWLAVNMNPLLIMRCLIHPLQVYMYIKIKLRSFNKVINARHIIEIIIL